MAEVQAGTPGSSTTGKAPAIKDKECQYCHQAFTSSSLGRHLDLYIKDKNAKPPDDLHNVEEIRRLRGNVTRRQARTSSGKRDGSTPSSSKPTPFRDQRSPSTQEGKLNSNPRNTPQQPDAGSVRTFLNKPNWQSTGVINDLPPMSDHSNYARRQSPSRRTSVKEEIIHKQNILEERDRARAAELALREVLDSVKAANARAHPPSPFDFNFFSLNFPELCLQCFSAPQSLLSSPEIPDPHSWSTDPPKVGHYEVLRDWVEDKLLSWHKVRQPQFGPDHNNQSNGTNGKSYEQPGFDIHRETEKYINHLTTSYDAWKNISEKRKQEAWLHECAKAFTREQERHKQTKRKLDLAEQEIYHLRSQLSQMYHPSDAPIYTPSTLPITRETTDHLPIPDSFSYESLLSKWKNRIQSTRSMQLPLPLSSPWATAHPSNLIHNHTNGTNYLHQNHGDHQHLDSNDEEPPSDEDEDLADAPGDDDDLEPDSGMGESAVDPNLRKADIDGDGSAGGRMLMGLRGHAHPQGGGFPHNAMDMRRG